MSLFSFNESYDSNQVYLEEGYYNFDEIANWVLENLDEAGLSQKVIDKVTDRRITNAYKAAPWDDDEIKSTQSKLKRNMSLRDARNNRLNNGKLNSFQNFRNSKRDNKTYGSFKDEVKHGF